MQTVRKKTRTHPKRGHIWWLIAAVAVLFLVVAATVWLAETPAQEEYTPPVDTSLVLYEYEFADIASITIQRGSEAPWTALPEAGTQLRILGNDSYVLTEEESADLLLAACRITVEDVLTDDPAVYAEHLADYGLDSPRYVARIVYHDGTELNLSVGNEGHDGSWRYMLIEGDNRLFAFSRGAVEGLFVNRDTLRKVSQPTLHKARINRITLTAPNSVTQWTMQGDITDTDAADKWHITAPFTYPADADAMANLLSSLSNLRLGAYVCPATVENLTQYGFDTPRLTIDIHMAAGTIGSTNADGAVEAIDWPESTVSFVIGGEKSDMVDYVLCGDSIYISSHFTIGMFIDYDVTATMSHYPVMTALGNLAMLSIREGDVVTEYILTRTEQVAANNELITDEDGNPIWDVTVTRNGESIDYAAFEAAYNALTLVTVSGTLPEGEEIAAEPHTVYTFNDVDGTMHTVALATFDVLHDAVVVDGYPAFYLIKDGFRLNLD